ncbi:PTS sugar transporter subunit IIA [Magnetococcales bacterium HHB-1]
MEFSQLISKSRIDLNLNATGKKDAIQKIAHLFAQDKTCQLSTTQIFDALWEREKVSTTGIGGGIAFPHGKLSDLAHPVVAIGYAKKGIAFEAMDDGKVFLIAALLSPHQPVQLHLQALSLLARKLREIKEVREDLAFATDHTSELWPLLTD